MSLPIIQTIQNNINSLNSSKLDIKNAVNTDYDFIANEQIESYPSLIKQGIAHYKNRVPHATKEGTDLSFDAVPLKFENMTIKGDTSQDSTTGKNLLDASLLPITAYGLTISKDDSGNIVINGTPNYQEGYKSFTIGRQKTVDAGTYTMSIANKKVGLGINVGGFSGYLNITMADTVTSKTTTSNATYTIQGVINIRYDAGTFDNYIFNPMFELGSTATDYEPYTNGASPNPDYPQPIHVVTGNNSVKVQGKNLFDGLINGYLGNNGNIIKPRDGYCISDFIIVEPNTQYTLSGLINNAGNGYKHICEYDENEQFLNRIFVGNANTEKKSFTTTATTKYIVYGIYSQFSSEQEAKNYRDNQKIQLELGSTATNYVPYVEPQNYPINLGSIELCKIGNYQDYLYKENGNWYKYGITSKIVFNGSENWRLYSSERPGRFYIQNFFGGTYPPTESFCDKFSQENYTNYANIQNNHYSIQKPNQTIWFVHTDTETLAEWKEWLSNNNVLLRYLKANPESKATVVQITDETLIAQLNAIDKAKGVDGTTIITIDSDDLKPILNFTAYLKEVE